MSKPIAHTRTSTTTGALSVMLVTSLLAIAILWMQITSLNHSNVGLYDENQNLEKEIEDLKTSMTWLNKQIDSLQTQNTLLLAQEAQQQRKTEVSAFEGSLKYGDQFTVSLLHESKTNQWWAVDPNNATIQWFTVDIPEPKMYFEDEPTKPFCVQITGKTDKGFTLGECN